MMNKPFFLVLLMLGGCFLPKHAHAQEEQELDVEQSAEVFLEQYSDEFQENFFEGLKQKGIQNYDRAIVNFLECQRLEPKNEVISFELAKSYFLDKNLMLAQESAIEAVSKEPENYWYADILVDIIAERKSALEEVQSSIPWDNENLRKNISEIYFKNEDYQTAKSVLSGLKNTQKYAKLQNRILDSLAKQEVEKNETAFLVTTSKSDTELNDSEQFMVQLKALIANGNELERIFQISGEANESYPSQPYFYYANGVALNRTGKSSEAIEPLETALDYLIDDAPLENSIYRELADAYTTLNNPAKADSYRRKIKTGF
jgi:predicted Zn-dependent protease